jgi:hypothetical protein
MGSTFLATVTSGSMRQSRNRALESGSPLGAQFFFVLLHLLLDHLDVLPLRRNRQPQPSEKTHVKVCDPDNREAGYEVAAPILKNQSEPGQKQHPDRDIVAEAVLAGEQVKEFARQDVPAGVASGGEPISEFPEDILVGNRPGHACDWNRKEEQQEHLVTDRHVENSIACRAKNQPSHS